MSQSTLIYEPWAGIMGSQRDFDAMAEACIKAGQLVKEHGSFDLQAAMRVALYVLGREIARQEARRAESGGRKSSGEAFSRIIGKRSG